MRTSRSAPGRGLDAGRGHDACGVGLIARVDGERANDVLQHAAEALSRLGHRGASGTDSSGDGAGVLTQIPRKLFLREARRLGLPLDEGSRFGVGAFFLPRQTGDRERAARLVEEVLQEDGLPFLGWREVPVDPAALGPAARASCPALMQAFVGAPAGQDEDAFERALYLARRQMEIRAEERRLLDFYVTSLSCRTVVYKALLTGRQAPAFFEDFHDADYETALAVFHQRFSTNTLPSWPLAQPFRMLAHNGEINTLWGNRNAMAMRRPLLDAPAWGGRTGRLMDVIWPDGSDSASLDNALELLVRSGRDPLEAAMTLLPQAWETYPDVDPDVRAFYELQQCLLEPWDGPAAIAFTDGVTAGAAVDRNGLRPCRFKLRRDGLLVLGSEVGIVDLDPRDVVESGGVGPGEVLLVDTRRGVLLRNRQAKLEVARRKPYARWVAGSMVTLATAEGSAADGCDARTAAELLRRQLAYGYSSEDLKHVIGPMAEHGVEGVFSMGDDTPIPPLSLLPRGVYAFFRQRFAQVTNPPIDALRESMVMSLRMHVGRSRSPLFEEAASARMLRVEHPVLLDAEMRALRDETGLPSATLEALFEVEAGATPEEAGRALLDALLRLARDAAALVAGGVEILILSDRGASAARLPIPMALAVGAVRHHLVERRLRAQTGLVVEAGDAFDSHHLAVLFGYGAEAVHPWLALASARALVPAGGPESYRAAAEKGLLKVLSKMGISTLSSYCGAQIFEVLGLGAEVIETCFAGTASPLGGLGFAELAEDVLAFHRAAREAAGLPGGLLPDQGRVRYRRGREAHAYGPAEVAGIKRVAATASPETYDAFVRVVAEEPPLTPRDLLGFRPSEPVPLAEVEPAEAILPRFVSSAMSLGALSPEAHGTLARAMNRIGALSNSGEGGEDPATFARGQGGARRDNPIKQVASARFGVTAEYLVNADELEIKIVQGAKPGEGGQLPAHKVSGLIARLRHAVPGIALISPPPHHDIYSIEDLAQLVHDLKCVNPRARVGVKLAAETGVGTVAAGVAKAYADFVLIAGHAGGTGASPLSSIKHTGLPWELGLAETQAALVRNGLRHRIEVRADGGLRSGRDVVMAALLGAERYGFGTAVLVALGCVMARQCHLNTCPTGIATQKEELRKRFPGTEDGVIAYFTLLAEDVRRILAGLGARSLDEVIGRNELLERVDRPETPRSRTLDLSAILERAPAEVPRRRTVERNERRGLIPLDDEILRDLGPCLAGRLPFAGSYPIRNHHLSVGARVSGAIAERFGDAGLPPGHIRLGFTGSAGQSFGAFAARGLSLSLEGEANDYVGKGLCGAEIAIRPFRQSAFVERSHEHQILGNTALYGATAGRLFAAGQAGNRFAVRNSGAVAVVEGTGNHACEYMTGGLVVVLGRAGRNFGAGMSNGLAYVLDEDGSFGQRVNEEMVELSPLASDDENVLQMLVREHFRRTRSARARALLGSWSVFLPAFRRVAPPGPEAAARARDIRLGCFAGSGWTEAHQLPLGTYAGIDG